MKTAFKSRSRDRVIIVLLFSTLSACSQNSNQLNNNNMFTLDQIKAAHAKVKTGADFPRYVHELKALGLHYYHNYVSDGHTDYFGSNGFSIKGSAKYPALDVANEGDKEALQAAIRHHQQGESDYLTVCKQAAEAGVEKWTVDLEKMTCTYYDKGGNTMMTEEIPEP